MTEREREEAKLSLDDLHTLAVRNLRRAMGNVTGDGTPSAREFSVGGDYESSLLLLDELWIRQADEWPAGVIAVAPTIGPLYAADAGDPVAVEMIPGSAHDGFRSPPGGAKTMLPRTGHGGAPY